MFCIASSEFPHTLMSPKMLFRGARVINMQNRYHHLFKVLLKAVKQRIQTNKTEMFYSAIYFTSRYEHLNARYKAECSGNRENGPIFYPPAAPSLGQRGEDSVLFLQLKLYCRITFHWFTGMENATH